MTWKITNENKREIAELMDIEPKLAQWEVAKVLGIHENTLRRWLQQPSDDQMKLMKQAIKQLRAAQE